MSDLMKVYENIEQVTLKLSEDNLYSGNLILVNRDNEFKQSKLELIAVDSSYFEIFGEKPIYINKVMKDPLLNLIDDINGKRKLIAVSGFRSEEEQRDIYRNSIFENGIEFTEKFVAIPKQSEHQTGLAIDLGEFAENIDFICPSFPDYGICKDFKDLAQDYGFIMRYKNDKKSITHISEEKWHFRYVGVPHARLMNKYNYCLEEYIDFLRQFKFNKNHLKLKEDNSEIEIFFVEKVDKLMEINIMKNTKYDVSGNNVDGFIITLFNAMGE